MENNWICKKCGSEVPNNIGICWNCQSAPNEPIIEEEIIEDKYFSKEDFNLAKIRAAGKQLKNAGRAIIILFIFHIIFSVIKGLSEDLKTGYYVLYYLGLFIGILIIAGIFFVVGDSLQEVIIEKKNKKKKNPNNQ